MVTVIQLDSAGAAQCGYDGMPHTSDRLWAYVREPRIVGIRDAKKGWHGALPGGGQHVLCLSVNVTCVADRVLTEHSDYRTSTAIMTLRWALPAIRTTRDYHPTISTTLA